MVARVNGECWLKYGEQHTLTPDHLSSRGRHLEAAQVYLDYASDVDAAVDVLCRGAEFAEAHRIVARSGRTALVEDVIHPALEEAHEALSEVFEEMDGQLDKEMKRLTELERIRITDPGEWRRAG
jgi:elongator complex protein 1